MKKRALVYLGSFILLLNLVAIGYSAKADPVVGEIGDQPLECKWAAITCPGGGSQEGCLQDGDGNSCTCGSVTRPCK